MYQLLKPTLFWAAFALLGVAGLAQADMATDIHQLQRQWATANYDTAKKAQDEAFKSLIAAARTVVERYPNKAEPKVWLAISLSTDAGVNGGFGALGKVKEARKHLLAAEKIDPNALQGSVYTSLGSLYYQVPGWPIGFGDHDKAREYLKKALSLNPNGIDPNYFYGDFLLEDGRYQEAVDYLNKASMAAPRENRPLADRGRQAEVASKLEEAKANL